MGLEGIFVPGRCAAGGDHVAARQHGAETDDVAMQHVDPTCVGDAFGLHPEILNGGFVGHQKSAE